MLVRFQSGNGNNETLKPTGSEPTWVIGKFGNALSFDGTDDYVDCNSNVGNFDLSDPFTIEAWINSALDNSDDVIYGNAWAEPGYHVRVTSENKVRFILIENGSIYKGIDSSEFTAEWHHIVAVWNGASVKIYVDGVDDSQEAIENGTVTTITTTANTKIGLDTAPAAHYFNGLIDEVRIWDKALRSEDILNPDISVEKSGPESAHADDIITYTYTVTNTGYVPLFDVTVSDDLVGDAVYVSGDDGNDFLEVGEIWIFTANYVVTFNDPEWLINIATAIGTDELDVTVGDEDYWTSIPGVPEPSATGRLIQTLGAISLVGQCSLTRNRNQSS